LRIIGIDPGSVICGYGVIDKEGSKLTVVEYGVIKAKVKSEDITLRLREIFTRLTAVIERTLPDEGACESTFYSKNVRSLVQLTQARAAALLAATMREVGMTEYAPLEVKKAVTGRGKAGKEQVSFMVRRILNIEEVPEYADATDALAVAVCHAYRKDTPQSNSRSWAEYVKNNPGKVFKGK
jgi:crossover junction endodeoxyribonuclease RuvC